MKHKKLDALFIGSHPDDIEITCGGTLIKLVRAGYNVEICDLTKGELSTRGNLFTRAKETALADKVLGIKNRYNLNLKDGEIENSYTNRLKLIRYIRTIKPRLIFAPYPSDRHPDHINAGNFIRESVFYSGLDKIKTGLWKPHRPEHMFYYRHSYDIPFKFIFDISNVFEDKIKAILCYKSQFYNENYSGNEPETYISSKLFLQDIETRARFFGFKIGVEFGEPFFCYEDLKVNEKNIFDL